MRFIFVFILLIITQLSFAQSACLKENFTTRISANDECLALKTYSKNIAQSAKTLIIFIHGDSPFGRPADYLDFAAEKLDEPNIIPIVLIRPGYFDHDGNYSTGTSYRFSGDGYVPHVIITIADAIKKLKKHYHAHSVILIGHSGGAAISAIILGKYPQLANAAVLASCPCDVKEWAKSHDQKWPRSLSPNRFITTISADTHIWVIVGKNDTNTYPALSKKYYSDLIKNHIPAKIVTVSDATHDNVIKTPAFLNAIQEAIR